jgi:hypothetical protein
MFQLPTRAKYSAISPYFLNKKGQELVCEALPIMDGM